MEHAIAVLAAMIVLAAVYVVLPVVADAYRRFRHPRLVVCPETGGPTTVQVDAARAAFSAVNGKPDVAIQNCAEWPARAGCNRRCAAEIDPFGIAAAPKAAAHSA